MLVNESVVSVIKPSVDLFLTPLKQSKYVVGIECFALKTNHKCIGIQSIPETLKTIRNVQGIESVVF